jgi:hypothetical protein
MCSVVDRLTWPALPSGVGGPARPITLTTTAIEAGCEDYCEREVDEVEWQGGRVYLHLGVRRDDPPRD